MILPDNETRVDLLNNEAIVATVIKILRTQQSQPVTIGVHGDWGAGKSSVLEMIEAVLGGSPRGLDQGTASFGNIAAVFLAQWSE